GVPEGTVAGRLARARQLLAARLARRGLAPSSAGAAVAPPSTTIEYAAAAAGGAAWAASFTKGVLKVMFPHKLKAALALLVIAATAALAAGTWPGTEVAAAAKDKGRKSPEAARQQRADAERPATTVTVRVVGPAGMKVSVQGRKGVIETPGT